MKKNYTFLNFLKLFLVVLLVSNSSLSKAQTITKEYGNGITFYNIVATNSTSSNYVTLKFHDSSNPTTPIIISAVTLSGTNVSEFSHDFTPKAAGYLDGETAEFDLNFNPTFEGKKSAIVTITYNNGNKKLEIPISAESKSAGVYAVASQINFGSVEVGQEKSMPMNLQFVTTDPNDRNKNIKINSIAFTGVNAADFIQRNNIDPSGYSGGGGDVSLDVTFQPKTGGNKTATVQVYHDGPGTNPVEITLTGSSNVPLIPILEITDVDFGTHDIFTTTTKETVLKNTGNTPLIISEISLTQNNDYKQFSIPALTFPIEIPAFSEYKFTSTFSPTENFTGTQNSSRHTQIKIVSNNNNETDNVKSIGLSSTILTPDFNITAKDYNFNDVFISQENVTTVTLENNGDGTLVLDRFEFSETGDFTVEGTSFPLNIAPNSTKNITVKFKPTTVGNKNSLLTFYAANDGDTPLSTFVKKFIYVNLTGNGIDKTLNQPTEVSFADTRIGNTETANFNIQPIHGASVTISDITITGEDAANFSITSETTKTIGSDEIFTVNLSFTPVKKGNHTATVTIVSDASNNPITVTINGNGITSKLTTSPTAITFVDTPILETSSNKNIVLSNTNGTDAVSISAINLTGNNPAEFKIDETLIFPINIDAGQSKNIATFFSPKSGGDKTATIEIVSNDSNSPQLVQLQANALSPELTFDKSVINYPKTDVSNKRTEFYTIKNSGNIDLKITSISVLGENADNFSQDDTITFPITIPSGTEKVFKVFFTPIAAGLKAATLKVNTLKLGFKELGLLATATAPVLDVSKTIDFGTLNKTTENDVHPITIKNTGTSNLKIYKAIVSGADASSFSVTNSFPVTIKPNNSLVLQTQFNFISTGVKNASIDFTTNTATTNNIAVTANLTNLPTFKAQAYVPLNTGEVGDKTFTPFEIENTGSSPLIIDGFLTLKSTSCCTSLEANHILPEKYKRYNKFPLTIPAGQKDSILITFKTGITDADKPIKVTGFLATNKATNSFDDYYLFDGDFVTVTFSGGVLRPKFEITTPTPLTALETSIGRTSEIKVSIKNTGNAPLSLYDITNDYAQGFYFKDYPPYVTTLGPEESKDFTIVFEPNGDFGTKNGLLKIKTRGDGTFNNPFVIHDIPISGVAVKPKEVTANGMTFKGDRISVNGDVTTLSGNVHADNLEFDSDVSVNTVTNVVTTNGQVFVLDIKKQGDLGGDKVLLAEGELEFKIDKDVQKVANLSMLAGSKITNKAFSLVGIPIKITKMKLIDDGVQVGGKLTLPPTVFGENAHITIETLEISKSRGVNIKGSAEINPELKVLKILSINSASVTFDTFTNSFSAKGDIELRLINQKVAIRGELIIINGGLDTVSLDVEASGGVPLANSGLALAGGNGFIKNIQRPPISLGLGVDIVPVAPPVETIRFDNLQIAYTFGTSFEASGNVKLFGEKLGSASLALYLNTIDNIYGVKVAASVNAYNILNGSADLSVLSKNNKLNIEGNSKLSVTIPKIKCFVCAPIDAKLPYKVATVNTYFNNTKITASLDIANIIEVNVKIESKGTSYKTTFGGNFKPLSIKFKSGLAAKGFDTNNLVFENNVKLQEIDPLEGRSLLVDATKNTRFKGKGNSTNIPFKLDQNYNTIILRLEGTEGTPNYTVQLPDGTEVTPTNAKSLGHYQSNYDEGKQNYYILNNVGPGNYSFKVNGTSSYQADIAGADFAPALTIGSLNYTPANDQLKINWTDSDLDSDAKIAFYYATDKKGNGNEIVTEISENDVTDSYTFDTSTLKNGTYYVYGKIDDGQNAPVISYAPQTFTISKASKVPVPTLTSNVFNNTIQLSWSPVIDADHYLVYIDDQLVSNLSSNRNAGSDTFYDIVNLSPGKIYQFAVTAVKANLTESNLSNIETVNFVSTTINNVPVILTETLPEKNNACGVYTTIINASDVDTKDILTYKLITAPEGMALNNNQIEWTPNNSQLGKHQVIVEVDDNNGGVVTKNYEVTVTSIDQEAPIVITKNISIDLGVTGTKTISVDDIDNGSTDNCTISSKSLSKDTFTNSDLGENTIEYTVFDVAGNSTHVQVIVTVTNSTLSVEDLDLKKSLLIYPNPTSNFIKLKYNTNSIQIHQIDVFDIRGKKVSNIQVQLKNDEINVEQLSNGIYFLRITSDKGVVTKRFSKQ